SKFLTNLKSIVSGMYLSTPASTGKTKSLSKFKKAMPKKYQGTLFAPHAYDAMFLMALAMHKAGEASGTAIAQNIRSVSRGDGDVVTVGQFSQATDILDNGGSLNYQGASSPVDLNKKLEPLNRFAILQVQDGSTTTLRQIPRSEFQ
ncbi:MAG: amino acid ABC transporter substrate-binding protein, partial [Halobacteriales archaeon]